MKDISLKIAKSEDFRCNLLVKFLVVLALYINNIKIKVITFHCTLQLYVQITPGQSRIDWLVPYN